MHPRTGVKSSTTDIIGIQSKAIACPTLIRPPSLRVFWTKTREATSRYAPRSRFRPSRTIFPAQMCYKQSAFTFRAYIHSNVKCPVYRYMNDDGVATVTDFLPRQPSSATTRPLLSWLIRRVEVPSDVPLCSPISSH